MGADRGKLPGNRRCGPGKALFCGWKPAFFHLPYERSCVLRPVYPACGLDAEEADREINLRLAEKILSPPEKERFDAAADRREALLRLWVLKEAAAKLSGEGLRGYPNHTDFSPDDPAIMELEGCFVALLTE